MKRGTRTRIEWVVWCMLVGGGGVLAMLMLASLLLLAASACTSAQGGSATAAVPVAVELPEPFTCGRWVGCGESGWWMDPCAYVCGVRCKNMGVPDAVCVVQCPRSSPQGSVPVCSEG